MSYRIAFNTNGGESIADVTAETDAWVDVPAATPGAFLSGRSFAGWVVTGHDRRTAVYSSDGGATETALDSDPAIVAYDGTVEAKNLAADGGLVQLSARWRVQFGGLNAGCPAIEVAPFTPICSKGDVDGSTPLTLDVPAPVFAPYIPPPECACFLFDSSRTANVNVTMHSGNVQNATGTAKVEISNVGDCCDGKYEVTPTIKIDIPECVTADYERTKTVSIGPNNASITYKWGMKNCVPFIEMTSVPFTPGPIIVPPVCLAPTDFSVKATYKLPGEGSGDAAHEIDNKTINLTAGDAPGNTGCKQYTVGDIELNLSALAFGGGGSVYKSSTDGNLYTDGDIDPKANTWYGGGYGDRKDNTYADKTYSRGPLMRTGALAVEQNSYPIPVKTGTEYQLTLAKGSDYTAKWHSSTRDGKPPHSEDAEGSEDDEWKTGNLNICMPTGFQWDDRGIAINLTTFEWNPSGVLSSVVEPGDAPIVAPGISVWGDDATVEYSNGNTSVSVNVGGMNASGIAVMKSPRDARQQPGLVIYDGDGLRIFGADGKTDETEITDTTKAKMGRLEVWDGNGLRAFGADAKTTAAEIAAAPSDKVGRLEVFAHDGDFKFNTNGEMVLNDEAATAANTVRAPLAGSATVDGTSKAYLLVGTDTSTPQSQGVITPRSFIRDTEAHMSAVVATGVSTYWARVTNDGLLQVKTSTPAGDLSTAETAISNLRGLGTVSTAECPTAMGYILTALDAIRKAANVMNNAMGTLGIVNVDVARSGVITNISNKKNDNIPRRYVKPQTSSSQGS